MRTCRFAFFLFDLDESGFLDMNEVESMVASVYGAHFADDERVKRVLDCLDANGDGEVSLSEWILFNKKYPMLLFPAYQLQEKLREKVIGKWWWDVMQFNRNEHFKNANVSTARTLENGRAHTPRAAERERRSESGGARAAERERRSESGGARAAERVPLLVRLLTCFLKRSLLLMPHVLASHLPLLTRVFGLVDLRYLGEDRGRASKVRKGAREGGGQRHP